MTGALNPLQRVAPHNIEAEQALLGAILVNNDAFYRVSDFLSPGHFFEPLHQTIFETAGSLVRAGKLATPITLKTFLPADVNVAGMTLNQYLARLAAEATTVINAEDYGRTVHDLSTRRTLIGIGEDMVNTAFDAPVDFAPREQIEEAERRLYEIAETGKYDGGFQRFATALIAAVDMAARAYQRDGRLSELSRKVEERDDKRPQLADLRESGSIEQDADVVLFVFREEYYLKNKEPRPGTEEHFKWQTDMEAVHGKAELIIGKQRHGPTGAVQLQFKADVTRFSSLDGA